MARNVTIQILRGVQANIPTLAIGEFFFATDTGNLFIGNPGFGLGYLQIAEVTQVNERLEQLIVLMESVRRALVSIACEGGKAKETDFDPTVIAEELATTTPAGR